MVGAGMPSMPVVNVNNFLNVKDSRWLQLEVCREFQRNKCTRPDTECKFAHPPPNVEVQNGRVTACYDSIKGRCNREKPPCKYFHPPQHLKDQLLVNGRNHLAMKNALMTQIQGLNQAPSVVPGTIPIPGWTRGRGGAEQLDGGEVASYYQHLKSQPMSYYTHNSAPYLTGIATMSNFNPYIASSPVMTMNMADGAVASHITGVVPQQVVPAQKVPRTDRLEAFPGSVVPYKRPAGDKSGMPVYQPTNTAAYQQALMQQLGGQSFVPVSCEYGGGVALPGVGGQADTATTATAAAAAANNHHAAASPAQPPTTSTSSPTSTTTSTNSPPSSTKLPPPPAIMANNSSSSSSSSTGGGEIVTTPVVPLGPQQPVNVFSYTGYSLSKGLRPSFKPPAAPPTPNIMGHMTMPPMSSYPPPTMQAPHMPNFHYGMGGSVPGLGMSPYVTSSQQMMMSPVMTNTMAGMLPAGLGGLTTGIAPPPSIGSMAGLSGLSGNAMPVMSPHIMLPQSHMSSLYHPQYTALSSNTQYTLAHGGEQPSKRLKTS